MAQSRHSLGHPALQRSFTEPDFHADSKVGGRPIQELVASEVFLCGSGRASEHHRKLGFIIKTWYVRAIHLIEGFAP